MKKLNMVVITGLILAVFSSVVSASLVAHWNFDNNSGGVAIDSSGNGNHGIINGAVDTTGVFGNALSFNGSGDYIDIADAVELNPTSAITVAAWFKANSFDLGSYSWPPIVAKYGSELGGYDLAIQKVFEGTPRIGASVCSSGDGWLTLHDQPPAEPVSEDIWYFTAMTYDGSTLTSYTYAGKENEASLIILSMSGSGSLITSTSRLNIGRSPYNTSRYFDAVIDEVRIYDTALDNTVINDLYLYNPEPATIALLGIGSLILRRRR